MEWFMSTGIRVIVIIAIAVAVYLICRPIVRSVIRRIVSHRMAGEDKAEIQQRTNTLSSILIKIIGIIILVVAVITILPEFGVNIATLIAAIGIGGLAIAFAAQSLVRDFIAGFFVLLEDQYGIGDVVSIAGIAGVVEDITLRRTVLRDLDANVHSIPNGKVEVSTNMTKKFSRVNLNVSVGYGENLKRVIDTINRVCQEMAQESQWKDDFITTPSVLRVDKLGDSGIDIKILGDTKPSKQWAIMGELRLRLKNTFDSEGIEIPWPHTKVYFGNAPVITSGN
jgi:small conductance mechanosensitive channel